MNTVQYKCPNCGAELTFDPEHQNFSCEFCDSTYTEAEMQQLYQNMEQQADQQADASAETLESETDDKAFENETRLYCQGCADHCRGETSATFCYYCHTRWYSPTADGRIQAGLCAALCGHTGSSCEKFHSWCKSDDFPRSFIRQLEKCPVFMYRSGSPTVMPRPM
ncbi:MAG: hypothetical protein ACLSFT_05375 [Ruminococcus callidus]